MRPAKKLSRTASQSATQDRALPAPRVSTRMLKVDGVIQAICQECTLCCGIESPACCLSKQLEDLQCSGFQTDSVSVSVLRHSTIHDSCGRKPASEMPTAKTYKAIHQVLPLLQLWLVLT